MKRTGYSISIVLGVLMSLSPALAGEVIVSPHVPMGAKLPFVPAPPGPVPDPDAFPQKDGHVTVQVFFQVEKGLDLQIKQFLTNPQERQRLWEMRSIQAEELGEARIPIMGSLETGEGMVTKPLLLEPGKYYLITLVADNRAGKEDIRFFVPAPNPKSEDVWLSWDTSSHAMVKIVPQCLCAGLVYTVPKGGLWYRVVGFSIDKDIPTPSRVAFVMTAMKGPRALDHLPQVSAPPVEPPLR